MKEAFLALLLPAGRVEEQDGAEHKTEDQKEFLAETDLAVLATWTDMIARDPQEVVDRVLSGVQR